MDLGRIGIWFFTDAGASHVCIQPVHREGRFGEVDWETLEALAS